MRFRLLFAALSLTALSAFGAKSPFFKEMEISREDEGEIGKAIYTVRLLPAESQTVDKLIFECQYRQTFPWENSRGEKMIKKHEPGTFKYQRKNERLTNDLDCHVNFRLPMSLELVKKMHGDRVFRDGVPVTVSRMTITGIKDGKEVFNYVVEPPEGFYRFSAKTGKPVRSKKNKKAGPKGFAVD